MLSLGDHCCQLIYVGDGLLTVQVLGGISMSTSSGEKNCLDGESGIYTDKGEYIKHMESII